MDMDQRSPTPLFSVRAVSRRTGLSADVLRAWEKRYDVVAPSRSDAGQRLYTAEEVERLVLLADLTRDGHPISRIAGLGIPELEAMRRTGRRTDGGPEGQESSSASAVELAVNDAVQLDSTTLENRLRLAALRLGIVRFLDEIAAPFAAELGRRWHEGSIRPIHEHVGTTVLRRTLEWIDGGVDVEADAPVILVTTPADQRHELGAQLAATAATSLGWRSVYPGANLPAEDIVLGAGASGARAVGLSIVFPTDDPALAGELLRIREGIGADVALLVGGSGAEAYREAIAAAGGTVVGGLAALGDALRALASGGSSPNERAARPARAGR